MKHLVVVLANLNAGRSQRAQSEALKRNTAGVWVFGEIGPQHERE